MGRKGTSVIFVLLLVVEKVISKDILAQFTRGKNLFNVQFVNAGEETHSDKTLSVIYGMGCNQQLRRRFLKFF